MLNPSRLITLSAVEQHDGVVGAAAALHLTPSAVSQQMRALEREAGVDLLDRSSRQIRLTEAGRRLAERGRRISREIVLAGDDLLTWDDDRRPRIRVAAFQSVICQLLSPMIAADVFTDDAAMPLTVRVTELEGQPALDALHAGQVDIVMTEELLATADDGAGRGAVTRLVLDDAYRIVVPGWWELPEEDPDALRDALITGPWVSQVSWTVAGKLMAELEQRWGFSARVAHLCNEYTSVAALVAAGAGAALAPHLPLPLTATGAGEAELRVLSASPDLGTRRVRVLCRPSRRRVASLDRVLELMAEQARTLGLEATLVGATGQESGPRGR